MLGSLLRLGMLAGTGAELATGFRHAMLQLAMLFAAALVIALMTAGAIGYFGVALYLALTPEFGPARAAAGVGVALLVVALALAVISRVVYLKQHRRRVSRASALGAGLGESLGGPLGAAALGASMGAGPNLDVKGMLGRNAMTVLLTAFIAGMVMNNRK